jgi:thioredoxin reductase (NADPH)
METRDIIIVGGGPAGLSAAIFTSLDGWDTLILEGNWVGGQAAIAYTVMNYPGFLPDDGAILMENLKKQVTSSPPKGTGAEIREEEVKKIDTEECITITEKNQYRAKAIILATGSSMKKLGVPGEEEFIGKGVSYYAKLDYEKFSGKRILVVGGGNTTAKSAILANTKAEKVLLIHRSDSLRAYPLMAKRLQKEGIDILYNTELKEIKGDDAVKEVILFNNKKNEEKDVSIDWIVICAGTEPKSKLVEESALALSGSFVKVDDSMMTSKEGIFACGEITGCDKHLISCASNGASAGMATSEYLAMEKIKRGETFKGAINGKYADEYLQMLANKKKD